MWRQATLLLLLVGLAGAAIAAHVTDKLLVGLYQEPDTATEPMRLLPSATPLEILQRRSGLIRVKLADGTEGWVESGYISEEKPARARLLETQAKLLELRSVVEDLEARLKQAELGEATAGEAGSGPGALETVKAEAVDASMPVDSPVSVKEPGQFDRYWPWLAMLVVAVLGFAAGVGFVERRIRRRFGGLSV